MYKGGLLVLHSGIGGVMPCADCSSRCLQNRATGVDWRLFSTRGSNTLRPLSPEGNLQSQTQHYGRENLHAEGGEATALLPGGVGAPSLEVPAAVDGHLLAMPMEGWGWVAFKVPCNPNQTVIL